MRLKSWIEYTLITVLAIAFLIMASEVGETMKAFVMIRVALMSVVIVIFVVLKKYGKIFKEED